MPAAPPMEGILGLDTLGRPAVDALLANPAVAHSDADVVTPGFGRGSARPHREQLYRRATTVSPRAGPARSMPPNWPRRTHSAPCILRRLRGGQHCCAGGDGRRRLFAERRQTFRPLLRHPARQRADHAGDTRRRRRHRSGTPEAELDIETVLSLAPQADIEVYEGAPRSASTTSSVRSSTTTRQRSSAPAGQTGAGLRRASHCRTRRTRSSRPRPPRGSRCSSLPGTRVRRGATSTPKSMPPPARTRSRRPSTLRQGPSTSPTCRATPSASTAREARAARRASTRGLCPHWLGPDAVALDATDGRCSSPTPTTRHRLLHQ